jgi:hypothetical protein
MSEPTPHDAWRPDLRPYVSAVTTRWPVVVAGMVVGFALAVLLSGGTSAFRTTYSASAQGVLDKAPRVLLDSEAVADLPDWKIDLAGLGVMINSNAFKNEVKAIAGSSARVSIGGTETTIAITATAGSAEETQAALQHAIDAVRDERRSDTEPRLAAMSTSVNARIERLTVTIEDIDAQLLDLGAEPGIRPSVEALLDARVAAVELLEDQRAAIDSIELARSVGDGLTVINPSSDGTWQTSRVTPEVVSTGVPAALMGGLLAALGLIFLSVLRNRVDNATDLSARLRLQHLGSISASGDMPEVALVGMSLRKASAGDAVQLLSYPNPDTARCFAERLAELELAHGLTSTDLQVHSLATVSQLSAPSAVVLVAAAHHTRRDDLVNIKHSLEAAGLLVVGAVLLDE